MIHCIIHSNSLTLINQKNFIRTLVQMAVSREKLEQKDYWTENAFKFKEFDAIPYQFRHLVDLLYDQQFFF